MTAKSMEISKVKARRVARNSQWGGYYGVWERSPLQPEANEGAGGGAPSARKFCIFLQK